MSCICTVKTLLFGICISYTSLILAKKKESYIIVKSNQIITIDGKLDEWNDIPVTSGFTNHVTGEKGTVHAFAQMVWDNQNLYIAFTVTDLDITATCLTKDANVFLSDDLVEMFFDFDGSGTNYLELGVSATGVNYDSNIICPGADCGLWNSDSTWDIIGLQSKTIIHGTINNSQDNDNGYTVEIKIPLSSLLSMNGGNYSQIKEGCVWKGNLFTINHNTDARIRSNKNYLSWSTLGTFNFHQPLKFANFIFGSLIQSDINVTKPKLKKHLPSK